MTGEPVLDQVNIVVGDMEAAVAFYRLLGIQFVGSDEWAPHHRSASMPGGIDLDLDSTAFAAKWNPGGSGGPAVFGFRVASRDEVDERHAALTAAGYRSQLDPHDAFWGSRYAIVEDPDANAVGIMSAPDPAFRSAPPDPAS